MKKISIFCCWNKEEILNSLLLPGLNRQKDVEFDLHLIYCGKGEGWKSAAQVFNYHIDQAASENLLFVHQDLELKEDSALASVIEELEAKPKGIFGLVGARAEGKTRQVFGNVYHGIMNVNSGCSISCVTSADTLDECFVAMKKAVFMELKFDEINFDGWHFYAVDLCLRGKKKGFASYVLPLKSQHKNILEMPGYLLHAGTYPKEFYHYARVARRVHKGEYKRIVGSCCNYPTDLWGFYFSYYIPRVSKAKLRRFFRKISF
ncbi:MAG: hypothetical protein IKM28_09920 [Lachnospiraceae bacterium]|nr:hypothetical protein [Lachnospiraceae bacterium]